MFCPKKSITKCFVQNKSITKCCWSIQAEALSPPNNHLSPFQVTEGHCWTRGDENGGDDHDQDNDDKNDNLEYNDGDGNHDDA